jgi:hsp70-interacting protein
LISLPCNNKPKVKSSKEEPPISDDALKDLLQELRDIVEPIDYARAFLSLKGLPFLLGCILETKAVLEIQLARIMHATSSCVRNHEVAETVFAHLEQAPALMAPCIDPKFQPSSSLQSITLFFLRALVTSDTATPSRVHSFSGPIVYVIDHCLQESNTPDLRETALALLVQLLEQKKSSNAILLRTDYLAALGVQRDLTGEDRDYAQTELESWTSLMILLARATPDQESSPSPDL